MAARRAKRTAQSKLDATPPWPSRERPAPEATTGPFDIRDAPADGIARVDLEPASAPEGGEHLAQVRDARGLIQRHAQRAVAVVADVEVPPRRRLDCWQCEGGKIRLSLWNHPGEGVYGMFARCERVVRSAERLLGGEVYHYHSKMIMKDPKVGGAWAWHQDYGYWYQNGVLFPLLTSVFIAVDPCRKENGCLQVLKRSHEAGRINHVLTGDKAGADRERVEELVKRLELVYVEMDPGDALFFHPNLLHRSDQNRSDKPRWSMICCYNAARNNPYKESRHPRYSPLAKVSDEAIKTWQAPAAVSS